MSSNKNRDLLLSSVGLNSLDSAALPRETHDSVQAKTGLPIFDDMLLKTAHPSDLGDSTEGPAHPIAAAHGSARILPATPGGRAATHAALPGNAPAHAQFSAAAKFDFSALNASQGHDTIQPATDPIHATDLIGATRSLNGMVIQSVAPVHHGLEGAVGTHFAPVMHTLGSGDGDGGGDPDGQLWEADAGTTSGNPDGHSDVRVEHDDSDGLSNDQIDEHNFTSAGALNSIGLDTAADLWFTVDNNDVLHVGHISTGAEIGTGTTIASTSDQDLVWSMVVDPRTDTIYEELFGGDYTQVDAGEGGRQRGGEIIKITYNPSTGAITNDPYNSVTFANNTSGILADSGSSNNEIALARSMALSADGGTMYFVDDNDADPGNFWHFKTNGIYSMSMSGSVGGGNAPTPTLLTDTSQFNNAVDGGNNYTTPYITALAVDNVKGIIYFTTDATGENVNTSEDAIWWMPIAGGTATKMTLPGGVSLQFDAFFSSGLAFDPHARQLYVSDVEQDKVIQLTLDATGHSFTSGINNFHTLDSNGDGAFISSLTWDTLPTEGALSGTSAFTTQGSGLTTTLLTAQPALSDEDGTGLNLSGYTVRVIGGTKGDGTSFGVTSGAIASGAGLVGDVLSVGGAISGTTDGGKIAISWNAATETLTLSGDQSYADYKSVLSNIVFQEGSNIDNTIGSHPTRTIDFIANDGVTVQHPTTTDPNEQTITITLNRAPTLANDSYSAQESGMATGTAGTGGTGVLGNDGDPDADSITVSQVGGSGANVGSATFQGTYGHLDLAADGHFTYTADNASAINAAASGSHPVDTITYQVSDGHGGTTNATVSFTINRAPTLVADSYNLVEGNSDVVASGGGLLINDSDKDGDGLTITAVNGSGGNVNSGTFAGTYGHFDLQTNGSFSYAADNTSAIDAAATGSRPTDSFTYTVSDGHGGTTTQTVTFTIDRAPTLGADAYNVVESGSVSGTSGTGGTGVLGNDSDKDGDSLTVSAVNGSGGNVGSGTFQGTYGHFDLAANGSFTYTADNTSAIDSAATGSHLTDTFTYTVSDGSTPTTQTITITLDRAPTVTTQNESVAESGTATGTGGVAGTGALAGDSDRDGDAVQATQLNGNAINDTLSNFAGTYGHLTIGNDGSYSYVADNTSAIDAAPTGSHPIDTFTVTVGDGHGGTTSETLNFTIDRPAIAVADAISTNESSTVTASTMGTGLLGNDSDPDTGSNAGLSVTEVNGSAGNVGNKVNFADGSFITVHADGTYTYDPNHAWDFLPAAASGAPSTGTETFTYKVNGGNTVNVTITIDGQDSNDILQGSAGNDTFNGGVGDDIFRMQDGGVDSVNGGVLGNDIFAFGASLTAADSVDGGSGNDRLILNGDYSGGNALVFGATTVVNVETIVLTAGHSYDLTTAAATVASGATLVLSGASLGAGDAITFDGAAQSDGHFVLDAGAGNDVLTGGALSDTFNLQHGGQDTAQGGAGNDIFNLGHALSAADSIDGGADKDTVDLSGDYTGGNALVLGATTLLNVETLRLAAGASYDLTTNDATVAAGQTLDVNAGSLGPSDHLTFDGSAESDGSFHIFAGAGNDVLTGGAGKDTFNLGSGGNDTAHGGGGNDTFLFGSSFTGADTVDGGAGTDTVTLNGDYSAGITLGSTTLSDVERLKLDGGHDYDITLDISNVTGGHTLTVDATSLGAANSLTFDGSALGSGASLRLEGGAGNDDLIGGAGHDTIQAGDGTNTLQGGGGNDSLTGGSGADTFAYDFASDSTSTSYDTIHGFDAAADFISILADTVTGVDATVASGRLSSTTFDTGLASAITGAQLSAHHAVLFDPTIGNLAGHTFLVVDVNGVAGYQAGQDLVIDVTGITGTLGTANFV